MLRGNTVDLTEFRESDREPMFRWVNDPETMRFNAPYAPLSWINHCKWFDAVNTSPDRIVFAIRTANEDQLLGTIQLQDVHPVHRTAELTMRIGGEADRGKGFGTEAVKLLIDFAWCHLNLQRVWLQVFSTNKRAIRAYEKAGLEHEGTKRRAAWIDGKDVDEHLMAILRQPHG